MYPILSSQYDSDDNYRMLEIFESCYIAITLEEFLYYNHVEYY